MGKYKNLKVNESNNLTKPAMATGAQKKQILNTIQESLLDFLSQLNCITSCSDKVESPLFKKRSSLREIAQVCVVLKAIHEAVQSGISITKRHIYYLEKDLFTCQNTVDRIIKRLSKYVFKAPKEAFNVIAAPKGFFNGNVGFGKNQSSATTRLIPTVPFLANNSANTHIAGILVVEKYTVFEKIVSSHWFASMKGEILVVTGCGFPDTATCVFVSTISTTTKCPVYCLVDFDPCGLDIFASYVEKLGDVVVKLLLYKQVKGVFDQIKNTHKLPLNAGDVNRLLRIRAETNDDEVKNVVELLLENNCKIEMEAFSSTDESMLLTDSFLPSLFPQYRQKVEE
ncbi:meiotic recombination protein SPO11, putative [Entamoeba invadens IP1]|uniref:DNA topoisomerase (ATP-hydrolyzing) n=1 Tax=Entamoeba invadens IP1 TaxID=370355 RepID=A0A0A1U8X8_ENTIV|nr:meiotic recombination protein SPO11, putative [Entamoeba invadens IP1]ELP88438.1 meiotic recombination protein SPO11, putative [Entamoeba invadens IP1]|eukprot:XP_004255209.1 meiotic recombination protein SPO11, putative [Entamoeba invadens IP1]